MFRLILAIWVGLLLVPAMVIGEPRHGLLWNRTGLPAVFPLQVQVPAGADYVLTLRSPGRDEAALAAYIEGGRYFRVLVPPGRFEISFVNENSWRDDAPILGSEALILPQPLTFGVRGVGRKGGYALDLTRLDTEGEVVVTPLDICQSYGLQSPSAGPLREGSTAIRGKRPETLEFFGNPLERRADELETGLYTPDLDLPENDRRQPRIVVRTRVCE